MPYTFKKLTGDGDCFFHGVAGFVNAGGNYPPIDAAEIRFRIARRAAIQLFPGVNNPLGIINQLANVMVEQKVIEANAAIALERQRQLASFFSQSSQSTAPVNLSDWFGAAQMLPSSNTTVLDVGPPDPVAQINAILNQLPAPDLLGDVSEVALKEAIPYKLLENWGNVPSRKAILVFFLYWYQRSYQDCLDRAFNQLAGFFGQSWCNYCIHGDISMNAEGSGQDSGFASHMVYLEFNLNLCAVYRYGPASSDNTLAYLRLCARDPNHAYLVHSGIHFDAAVWEDQVYLNDLIYELEGDVDMNLSFRPFAPVSRCVRNSHRASFVFGAAVWNMNHLAPPTASTDRIIETKKRSKGSRASSRTTKSRSTSNSTAQPKKEEKSSPPSAPKIDKNPLKLEALENLGALNKSWLDVLGLNEVNNIDALTDLKNWKVYPGPRMLSVTANGDGLRGGQPEFYPLLIAKDAQRDFKLEYRDCYCVDSKGAVRRVLPREELKWTKPGNEAAVVKQQTAALIDTKRTRKPSLKVRENAEISDEESYEEDSDIIEENSDDDVQEESDESSDSLEYDAPRRKKRKVTVSHSMGEGSAIQESYKSVEGSTEKQGEGNDSGGQLIHRYRPVVVHRLIVDQGSVGELQINVAILHTTPSGSEYNRWDVYSQLDKFFRGIGDPSVDLPLSPTTPVHWIVLGDFYLFEESRITTAVEEKFNSAALILKIKELYQSEVAEYEKAWKLAVAASQRGKEVTNRLARIIQITTGMPGLENALRATSNGAIEGLEIKFKQLIESVGVVCPDKFVEGETDTFDGFKKLGMAVSKLFQFNFPFANADRWIDWWILSIPKCLEQGLIDQPGKLWKPPRHEILMRLNQASEQLKDQAIGVDKKLEMCSALLGNFGALLLQVNEWNVEESKAGAKKQKGDEREKYVAPLNAFEKNAKMSGEWMNRLRNVLGTSFAAQMREKFHVLQTIWGTNIHTAAVINSSGGLAPKIEYSAFRIADFAVCSKTWRSCELGVFHHKEEGIVRVDDKCVTTTVHWRGISDHFPIGGRFSLGAHDRRVQSVFVEERDADYIAARNVLYIRDLYQGIRPNMNLSGVNQLWPTRDALAKDAEARIQQTNSMSDVSSPSLYAPIFNEFKEALVRILKEEKSAASILVELSELNVTDPDAYGLLRRIAELWVTIYPMDGGFGIWQLETDGVAAVSLPDYELFPELAELNIPGDIEVSSVIPHLGPFIFNGEEFEFNPGRITFEDLFQ